MNPKDRFDFKKILGSFLDQSRRLDQELQEQSGLPLAW